MGKKQQKKRHCQVEAHFQRDRKVFDAISKNPGKMWEYIVRLVKTARSPRHSRAGMPDEMISISGHELGVLNRIGAGFGSKTKAFLRTKKIAHIDSSGTLYIHVNKLPEGIKALVRREASRKGFGDIVAGKKKPKKRSPTEAKVKASSPSSEEPNDVEVVHANCNPSRN